MFLNYFLIFIEFLFGKNFCIQDKKMYSSSRFKKISSNVLYCLIYYILAFSSIAFAQIDSEGILVDFKNIQKPRSFSRLSSIQNKSPIFIKADQIEGRIGNEVFLKGNVKIRYFNGIIEGNSVSYCSETGRLIIKGNAQILKDEIFLTGSEADFNLRNFNGLVEMPKLYLKNGLGFTSAKKAFLNSEQASCEKAIYTKCYKKKPCWHIKADNFDVHFSKNIGSLKNGVLYFKNFPFFFIPYLTFPNKKEKKSGFLSPSYEMLSQNGLNLIFPYYLNLSKNYDITIIPKVNTEFGLLFDMQFRYLENERYNGEINIFSDSSKKFSSSNWIYQWSHKQKLSSSSIAVLKFSKPINIKNRRVNNDYSMEKSELETKSFNQLPLWLKIENSGQYWNSYIQMHRSGNLKDGFASQKYFDKVPEVFFYGDFYNFHGFNGLMKVSAVRFKRNYFGRGINYDGTRLQIYPALSYSIKKPGFFLEPKIGMHCARYQTAFNKDNFISSSQKISRDLPILSFNSEFSFERYTSLFGDPVIQTIDPRIFYLYIPYRYQDHIPVYDTEKLDFGFSQAFEENSYSGGWDRISHANQVVLSFATHWFHQYSGVEKISLSALQSFYLGKGKTKNSEDQSSNHGVSDFLFFVKILPIEDLTLSLSSRFDPYQKQCVRSLVSASWESKKLSSVSIFYNHQKSHSNIARPIIQEKNKQLGISFQWPLSEKLYGVGRIDYSFHKRRSSISFYDSRIIETIVGIEYKEHCWSGKLVFYQKPSILHPGKSERKIFFQIELEGLGSIGASPTEFLMSKIPGYQRIRQFNSFDPVFFYRHE